MPAELVGLRGSFASLRMTAAAFGMAANELGNPPSTGFLEFFPQLGGLLEFALEFAVTQMAFHERDFFN